MKIKLKHVLYYFLLLTSFATKVNANDDVIVYRTMKVLSIMMSGNYNEAYPLLSMPRHSVNVRFDRIRSSVLQEFDLDYFFKPLGYNKMLFTRKKDGPIISNTHTTCLVQIEDRKRFSLLKIDFDKEGKISDVAILNTVYPKPDTRNFWVIGIPIMLLVLGFNIYVIIIVAKSRVTRKWLKYLMIVFLNLPVIGYNVMSGIIINLLSLRLMGISFSTNGYLNTYWAIGIPIGAIIAFLRLKSNLYRTKDDNWVYDISHDRNSTQLESNS